MAGTTDPVRPDHGLHCTRVPRRAADERRSGSARRRKYGKYLPHQRANVDQAPLPFVNDMDSTYDEVGAKSVSISQLGG